MALLALQLIIGHLQSFVIFGIDLLGTMLRKTAVIVVVPAKVVTAPFVDQPFVCLSLDFNYSKIRL